jgi:hypothetical protein
MSKRGYGPIESALNAYVDRVEALTTSLNDPESTGGERSRLRKQCDAARMKLGELIQVGTRNLTKIDPEYDLSPLMDLMQLGDALRGTAYEEKKVIVTGPT